MQVLSGSVVKKLMLKSMNPAWVSSRSPVYVLFKNLCFVSVGESISEYYTAVCLCCSDEEMREQYFLTKLAFLITRRSIY